MDRPWLKPAEAPPAYIHGADGLGNLPDRMAVSEQLDLRPSAQFIVDMARANPGEITLVAVGPLGNLSLALLLEPALPSLLKQVILMGGTVLEPGNVSPWPRPTSGTTRTPPTGCLLPVGRSPWLDWM